MEIQITDSLRNDVLNKIANHIQANNDLYMILSHDQNRTSADNSNLNREDISSIYDGSYVKPKYIKKIDRDNVKYGGVKTEVGALTGGTDITYNNLVYSVIAHSNLANNKNKGLTNIYVEDTFSVDDPALYNIITFVISSGLTADVDFTETPGATPPVLSPDTVIVAQVRPASIFLPGDDADIENKTIKLLLKI